MKYVICAVFCASLAINAAAQVNRCVDAKSGKVTYSDGTCPAASKATQIEAARTDEAIQLERERAQLARERHQLEQEKRQLKEQNSPAPQEAPRQARVDSYACDVATRNLGVGANRESKMRSQRQYEVACFGGDAAAIEQSRQGRTIVNSTTIVRPPATQFCKGGYCR